MPTAGPSTLNSSLTATTLPSSDTTGSVALSTSTEKHVKENMDIIVVVGPSDIANPSEDPNSPDYVKIKLTKSEFASVFIGLALAIFLASLDQTIVATAIPAILNDFHSLDKISWIGTSYLLTSTAFAPLYGKFADIFGRKPTFLFAVAIFEIGSLICGAANSIELLIVGRAVSGVGGGGIISLVLIIISDIVSFRDRGKYQGIIGAVFGLSSVLGPLLGGTFTDTLSWRWCFYINIPIGGITFAVILFLLRFPSTTGSAWSKLSRVDLLGTILIVATVICLLIPLQYGGGQWAWSDWRIIVMFIVALIFLALFIIVEIKVSSEPVIPPAMFENASVYALLTVAFLIGASFFGLVYFLPSYFQLVNGSTATQAGLATIPLVGGLVVMSIITGQLVSRFGYYKPFLFIGSILLTIGAVLISTLSQHSTHAEQIGYLLLAGLGVGCMIQIRTIGIQASVSPHNIAVATSSSTFFQSLGGSIGVAIVGTIFNNVLQSQLGPELAKAVSSNPDGIKHMSEAQRNVVLDGFTAAFGTSYKATIPLAAIIFLVAFVVKQKPPTAKLDTSVALE
ncbi:hypothetical protein BASA50_000689 [Batrachochytrium salamandrivorans]|uniref:Major facilitator superfamily (MFS) profile domain-containing protein n=1 Tax=Batrachochytrium salamandrivorans TaxID=1357716 RepID=A0ABQ8ET92_9FUNG|nr:hypothetical protein BASA50_000689 [Batrachochytrium salamandrivorans]